MTEFEEKLVLTYKNPKRVYLSFVLKMLVFKQLLCGESSSLKLSDCIISFFWTPIVDLCFNLLIFSFFVLIFF